MRVYVTNPAFSFYIGLLPAVKNDHCLPESQGFSSKGAEPRTGCENGPKCSSSEQPVLGGAD